MTNYFQLPWNFMEHLQYTCLSLQSIMEDYFNENDVASYGIESFLRISICTSNRTLSLVTRTWELLVTRRSLGSMGLINPYVTDIKSTRNIKLKINLGHKLCNFSNSVQVQSRVYCKISTFSSQPRYLAKQSTWNYFFSSKQNYFDIAITLFSDTRVRG